MAWILCRTRGIRAWREPASPKRNPAAGMPQGSAGQVAGEGRVRGGRLRSSNLAGMPRRRGLPKETLEPALAGKV
jgi:hypothetical protein